MNKSSVDEEVSLVPVDNKEELLDPGKYLSNGFKDAYFRSQQVRGQLWGLVEPAREKLRDTLSLPTDDPKTLPSQIAAAKYVLDAHLIKYPDVSHRSVEISDNRSNQSLAPHTPVSRQEVIEAAIVAIEAEDHRGERTPDTDATPPERGEGD